MNLIMKILLFPVLLPIYYLKWRNSRTPALQGKTIAESFQLPHEKYPEVLRWEKGDKIEFLDGLGHVDFYYFECINEKGIITLRGFISQDEFEQFNINLIMRKYRVVNIDLKTRKIKTEIKSSNRSYQEYLDDYKIGYNQAEKL